MQQLIIYVRDICAFRSLWYNILLNLFPSVAARSREHSFTFVRRSSMRFYFFLSSNFNGEWNMYFYCYPKPLNVIAFYKVNNVNKSMCSRSHINRAPFSTVLTSPQISPPPKPATTHENQAKQKQTNSIDLAADFVRSFFFIFETKL